MVRPGELTKRAVFERRTTIAGDFESGADVWTTLCEAYVCLQTEGAGSEQPEAKQMQERVPYKVTFRWGYNTRQITAGDRMVLGDGRTFQLTSVVNLNERNHWIEAMVTESR